MSIETAVIDSHDSKYFHGEASTPAPGFFGRHLSPKVLRSVVEDNAKPAAELAQSLCS